jgi:hypothetical protein
MRSLIAILVLSVSLAASADEFNHTVRELLEERACPDGGDRQHVTIPTSREESPGDHYFGATSYGDLAAIQDNKLIHLYLCKRPFEFEDGEISSDISLTDAGINCSVGEILKLNLVTNDLYFIPFRSIRFDEHSQMCEQSVEENVNDSLESSDKDSFLGPVPNSAPSAVNRR